MKLTLQVEFQVHWYHISRPMEKKNQSAQSCNSLPKESFEKKEVFTADYLTVFGDIPFADISVFHFLLTKYLFTFKERGR